MKKYPKTIYVVRENAGTHAEYLMVLGNPKDVDLAEESKRTVMVYELTKTVVVTKEIKVK